jgi:ketosteroid isomerase-like protein
MSQENVDVVRRIYAAWEQEGSFAASGLLHPAIVWTNPSNAIETGTRVGTDAFEAAMKSVTDSFGEVHFDIDEYVDTGDDVVALLVMRAQGRTSGASVEDIQGHVWTLDDGKAVRVRWFHDPHEALEAAGLSE